MNRQELEERLIDFSVNIIEIASRLKAKKKNVKILILQMDLILIVLNLILVLEQKVDFVLL